MESDLDDEEQKKNEAIKTAKEAWQGLREERTRVADLEKELEQLENVHFKTTDELQLAREKIANLADHLTKESQNGEAQVTELAAALTAEKNHSSHLAAEATELRAALSAQNNQSSQFAAQVTELSSQLSELQAQATELETQYSNALATERFNSSGLQDRVTNLEGALAEVRFESSQLLQQRDVETTAAAKDLEDRLDLQARELALTKAQLNKALDQVEKAARVVPAEVGKTEVGPCCKCRSPEDHAAYASLVEQFTKLTFDDKEEPEVIELIDQFTKLTFDGKEEEPEVTELIDQFGGGTLATPGSLSKLSFISFDSGYDELSIISSDSGYDGSTINIPSSPSLPPATPHTPATPVTPRTLPISTGPYDARDDDPTIDKWWFDHKEFDKKWKPAPFEYRRCRPYCEDCRTRRALRLVNGEWTLPEDFNLKVTCPAHPRLFSEETQYWLCNCPDCIQLNAPQSGEEDSLPEGLKEKYRCRDVGCQLDVHAEINARARWVLLEYHHQRQAAQDEHKRRLEEGRAAYGPFWPFYKGVLPPKNFVYGAVTYGRGQH